MTKADYDFMLYSVGLIAASVCTSLPIEKATERLNLEHPSGVTPWHPSEDKTFRSGEPNPCPCDRYPETHKHYLFNC